MMPVIALIIYGLLAVYYMFEQTPGEGRGATSPGLASGVTSKRATRREIRATPG